MRVSVLLFLAILGTGCDGTSAPDPSTSGASEPVISTVDLGGIAERGALRVILGRERETYLPRHGAAL